MGSAMEGGRAGGGLALWTGALLERHAGRFGRRLVFGLPGEQQAHTLGTLIGARFFLSGLPLSIHVKTLGCALTWLPRTRSGKLATGECG